MLSEKEALMKKYATNEFEKEYIEYLNYEVFEQVLDVIQYEEECNEKVTFLDVIEQAMVACIHKYDFKTKGIIEERFPNVDYTMLHYKSSESEYSIRMDDEGNVIFEINMTPDQHMIMTLLNTLEEMEEYFYEQGVAGHCIIKNTVGVNELTQVN